MPSDAAKKSDTVSVDINGERAVSVAEGSILLVGLRGNGIFIPSACGGRSMCGTCRVKVISGGGEPISREGKHLTQEDFDAGMRLSCCLTVENDIEIEIPESLFSVKEYETTVERIRDLTYDVKEFRLKVVSSPSVDFEPGQYMQFKIPAYAGSVVPAYRAYSISDPPSDKGYLEFAIRRVPAGIGTTYLFDHLQEGDTLMINGPYGDTTLREGDSEILFIAGSTGVAPIKSMLHLLVEKSSGRKATFYFGAVRKEDLFYMDEMKRFETQLEGFSFVPALSDRRDGSCWTGEEGLITEVVDRCCDDLSEAEAYLCGSPGMINACIKVLESKRIRDGSIFYDKFA